MGFFDRFINNDKENLQEVIEDTQKQELALDNDLIRTLRTEQKVLFKKWERIVDVALETDEFTFKLKDTIDTFVKELDEHVNIENKQLYTYLYEKYADEPDKIKLIRKIEKKMKSMVKEIGYFSKKYGDRDNCNRCFEQLVAELDIKTNEFLTCMNKKEDLYTMYR